jgi:hypothetical protein
MKTVLLILLALGIGGFAPPSLAQQQLGRLFFTDEQRAALDARRKARVPDTPSAAPVVASPTTRLDGFVTRSGGPTTVWVNGEAAPESVVRSGGRSAAVRAGEGGARVELKPGQVLDRSSGEVRDVIGDGEIRIHRGAPR